MLLSGLLVITTAVVVFAQQHGWFPVTGTQTKPDAKEEFKKVMSVLNASDSVMHVSGVIRVYDQENKNKLQEQNSFIVEKNGHTLYSRMGYQQTIGVDSILVEIDTVNQLLSVSNFDANDADKILSGAMAFDRYLEDTGVFKMELSVKEISKEQRAITIINPMTPEIKSSTLYYDASTYKVIRSEIDWWKSGMPPAEKKDEENIWHTEIVYQYRGLLTVSAAEKMKRILSLSNGVVSVMPAYKNYQLTTSF